jgi:hypothetical protein
VLAQEYTKHSARFDNRQQDGLTWRKEPSIAVELEEGHNKEPSIDWKKKKKRSLMCFRTLIPSWE